MLDKKIIIVSIFLVFLWLTWKCRWGYWLDHGIISQIVILQVPVFLISFLLVTHDLVVFVDKVIYGEYKVTLSFMHAICLDLSVLLFQGPCLLHLLLSGVGIAMLQYIIWHFTFYHKNHNISFYFIQEKMGISPWAVFLFLKAENEQNVIQIICRKSGQGAKCTQLFHLMQAGK